jgi:hypothetical protein
MTIWEKLPNGTVSREHWARIVADLGASGFRIVPAEDMTDAMMTAGQRYLDSKALNGNFRLPGTFNWHDFWQAILKETEA